MKNKKWITSLLTLTSVGMVTPTIASCGCGGDQGDKESKDNTPEISPDTPKSKEVSSGATEIHWVFAQKNAKSAADTKVTLSNFKVDGQVITDPVANLITSKINTQTNEDTDLLVTFNVQLAVSTYQAKPYTFDLEFTNQTAGTKHTVNGFSVKMTDTKAAIQCDVDTGITLISSPDTIGQGENLEVTFALKPGYDFVTNNCDVLKDGTSIKGRQGVTIDTNNGKINVAGDYTIGTIKIVLKSAEHVYAVTSTAVGFTAAAQTSPKYHQALVIQCTPTTGYRFNVDDFGTTTSNAEPNVKIAMGNKTLVKDTDFTVDATTKTITINANVIEDDISISGEITKYIATISYIASQYNTVPPSSVNIEKSTIFNFNFKLNYAICLSLDVTVKCNGIVVDSSKYEYSSTEFTIKTASVVQGPMEITLEGYNLDIQEEINPVTGNAFEIDVNSTDPNNFVQWRVFTGNLEITESPDCTWIMMDGKKIINLDKGKFTLKENPDFSDGTEATVRVKYKDIMSQGFVQVASFSQLEFTDTQGSGYVVSAKSEITESNIVIPSSHLAQSGMKVVTGLYTDGTKGTFEGCSAIQSVVLPGSGLSSYPFSSISKSAFKNCTNLTKITTTSELSRELQIIDEYAFYNCGLTSLDFSNFTKLNKIAANAFVGCSNLSSIKLFTSDTTAWKQIGKEGTIVVSDPEVNAANLTSTEADSWGTTGIERVNI